MRDFEIGRLPVELVSHPRDRAVDIAAHPPDRPRRPVHAAQRIHHRAVDTAAREGIERHAECRLEAARRLDQPHHADAHELVQFDVGGDTLGHTRRQRLHQTGMSQHEPVAGLEVPLAVRDSRLAAPADGGGESRRGALRA
jgi:hypothetical protein